MNIPRTKQEIAAKMKIRDTLLHEDKNCPEYIEYGLKPNQLCVFSDQFMISYNEVGYTTTAIMDRHFDGQGVYQDCTYYLLKGDYRKEMLELGKEGGIEKCIEFYNQHPELQDREDTI